MCCDTQIPQLIEDFQFDILYFLEQRHQQPSLRARRSQINK